MLASDYPRIERAIQFLEANYREQPSLEQIARSVHLSKFHFQRVFTRWAGLSPKQFLQVLTLDHAKRVLADSRSVLDATFSAGLSSPGRLHDLFITHEAITPGEFKGRGAGLNLQYGLHPNPFGLCLLAISPRGICALRFLEKGEVREALAELRGQWAGAELRENSTATQPFAERIFNPTLWERGRPLHLVVKGTNFQIKVWEALLKIPAGGMVSYGDIAAHVGRPRAARAVGNAVGENPIAFLIPCHRVILGSGAIGNYRYGTPRKKAILAWEAGKVGGGTGG